MTAAFQLYLNAIKRPTFLFLLTQCILRFIYLALEGQEQAFGLFNVFKILSIGFLMDVFVASFIAALMIAYRTIIPWGKESKGDRYFRNFSLLLFLILVFFSFVADILFWAEFKARFNFIAVDYLVYSKEVVANIRESYNLPVLLGLIAFIALGTLLFHRKTEKKPITTTPSFFKRLGAASVFLALPMTVPFVNTEKLLSTFDDQIQREIAQNGWYTFVHAFFHNSIQYDRFYVTTKELGEKPLVSLPVSPAPKGPEKHHNVIFVLMESMSAEFMKTFGCPTNETPNLDRFAQEGILFERFYATGTRTVRGMEALVLAIPPVPGQAIVRQPENENLHSIGFEFQKRGYDTVFIYGGNGYFDNMNTFMSGNGFRIVDRDSFSKDEIQFENAWGMCDEDIFYKVIKEADAAHAAGKPFMHLALTTSNHRPYTFPDGKIDLPSKSGRASGVKYSDFAIGELVRLAKQKPWFDNTLFVFVADHTAGTTGRLEITPEKHHIPAIIYAPKLVKPQRIKSITSQIDLPVTVMGLLNFKFTQPFFGQDALKGTPQERAFLSHFQKIGYYDGENLLVMKPVKESVLYHGKEKITDSKEKKNILLKAVPYYEAASKWKENYKKLP